MSTPEPPESPPESRLVRARERARRTSDWASEHVPGSALLAVALERERLGAAGLLAGGLAYRLFFWLVPLGLVFAAVLSFWVDVDPAGLEDAAEDFGIGGAATQSAMNAIEAEHHARWYFLLTGIALVIWFGMGVVRALIVSHAVAWGMRPEKLRRPLVASLTFTGVLLGVIALSSSTQTLRRQFGVTGLLLTLLLLAVYVAAAVWMMDKLPHRGSRRDLWPGALLLAFGTQVMHLVVALYLAPKLGRSSELYGTLGAATVVLLWLYLLARLVVAGAFLNAALWEQKSGELPDQLPE